MNTLNVRTLTRPCDSGRSESGSERDRSCPQSHLVVGRANARHDAHSAATGACGRANHCIRTPAREDARGRTPRRTNHGA